jgi:hypothetical protein
MPISGKTKVALIRALASRGHSGISLLAIELELDGRAVGGNRLERCMSLVKAIEMEREPNKAVKVLLDLAEDQLKTYSERNLENDSDAIVLRRALELDGYAFDGDRLVPAVPGAVALEE